MKNLLNQQLDELLANSPIPNTELQCEGALRVGAATLCRVAPNEITATTVMCDLHEGMVDVFESLVQAIADEYGLEASIHHRAGSCSVRFTCPQRAAVPIQARHADKSMLARLLRR
jgi:hypothetical protein